MKKGLSLSVETNTVQGCGARSFLIMNEQDESCEKCEGEIQEGNCQICFYSDEDSLTHEEAREFTSPG